MKFDWVAHLPRARVCFFDCDGVIFDSNRFKVDAMLKVLEVYPEPAQEKMLEYWRNNGGASRHAKFQHFFSEIVEVDDPRRATAAAVLEFGKYSALGYREVDPLPEALQLARHLGRERAVVVSGALQDEIQEVFRVKGIDSAFAEVLGSPTKKLDLVRGVLDARRLSGAEALLIGDGALDHRVCLELEIPFVYLARYSEWRGARAALEQEDSRGLGSLWADNWPTLLSSLGL